MPLSKQLGKAMHQDLLARRPASQQNLWKYRGVTVVQTQVLDYQPSFLFIYSQL